MSKVKIKKLEAMIGKSWADKSGQEFKFLSVNIDGDMCTIATDSNWLKTSSYDIDVFVEKYTLIPSREVSNALPIHHDNKPTHLQSSVMPNDTMTKLRDTLLANIEKVKEDREYIPQAKMISDSINSLIGLAKIEIDLRTKL